MDPRVQAMADVLVNYSIAARPGQWIVIQCEADGEPLGTACTRAALRAGAHPDVYLHSDEAREVLLREGNDEQLSFISPIMRTALEQADAVISIIAPRNTRALTTVNPERMALTNRAMEPVMAVFMERSAKKELAWTVGAYPTYAAAQDASMSLPEYENFVFGAGLLSEPDPVAAWQRLGERQARLIDWIKDKDEIHVTGPGTNLKVSVKGRTWDNDDGHYNFPGGEIFTGPIEDSAEGEIQFNYPSNYGGREVSGIRLRFQGGKVVDAGASSDEPFLIQMLDTDDGSRRLGEFAFGTNPGITEPTKSTLFDEKIGGTLHMALGRSYPETGGTNISSLHWDIVYNLREGSEVKVDGQLFSRNGEFCV